MAYFKKLTTKGEVSKAFRAIVTKAKVLPYSLTVFNFFNPRFQQPLRAKLRGIGTKNTSVQRTPF